MLGKPKKPIASKATLDALDELFEWCDSSKRLHFCKLLVDYFDPESMTLIVRAVDKAGLEHSRRKR